MRSAGNRQLDRIASSMLNLCLSEFDATFAMLFWFDDQFGFEAPETLEMPGELLPFYRKHVGVHDPLNVLKLAQSQSRLVSLRQGDAESRCFHPAYAAYLDRFDLHDELDLIFWHADRPAAGLALFRCTGMKSFSADQRGWDVIHAHFDCMLQAHERLRGMKLRHTLSHRYGLTASEGRIAEAMMGGASNGDIADLLDLRLSTVKSYAFSIFNKMGVETRTAVVAALYNAMLS